MVKKTFCRCITFVLILTLLSTCLWSGGPDVVATQKEAHVTISVYNAAGVPGDVVVQAEDEASRIFRRAGIEVKWLDCEVPAVTEEASRTCREAIFPEHLHLRIIRKSATLRAEAMGVAFQTGEEGAMQTCFTVPWRIYTRPKEQMLRVCWATSLRMK